MGTAPAGRWYWSVVLVALAVAALSVALAVTSLVLADDGSKVVQRAEQDRRSALEAARERTLALTSYDYRQLAGDFGAVLATATGSFKSDYETTSRQLGPTFLAAQAMAAGNVVAAGLESGDGVRAVAVVAVDQVIRTKGAPPRTERNRLRMTLVRPAGVWLVERVERL